VPQAIALIDKKFSDKIILFYCNSSSIPVKEAELIQLMKQLPTVMGPSYYIALDSFPLGPHGKVNKEALYQYYSDNKDTSMPCEPPDLLQRITEI
jgi:hypothetical protein